MKKFLSIVLPASIVILTTGCGTGPLENQIATLTTYQSRLNIQRDSLVRLLAMKTDTLKSRDIAYDNLSSDKTSLEAKAKALQTSLITRTKQLKTAEALSGEKDSALAKETAKNDSLMKEIAILHQKIAEIDSKMNEEQNENVALNESLRKEAERRRADSTAFANAPKPEIIHKGFVHIGELGAGIGLGDTEPEYSTRFISADYILGYNINNNFMVGAGTGANFYNGGVMLPLFLDVRYHFKGNTYAPFFSADGGMLFSTKAISESGLFINPQFGIRRNLNDRMKLNLSTGLYLQQAPSGVRNSFINLKGGFTFGK